MGGSKGAPVTELDVIYNDDPVSTSNLQKGGYIYMCIYMAIRITYFFFKSESLFFIKHES